MLKRRASPNRRQELGEVLVTGLSHDGRGLARTGQGKTVFVDGALPGETVRVQVLEDRRRFINTRVQNILHASKERVESPCKHFKQCGGCSLQYWSHDGQLTGKQAIVLDQLKRFSSLEPELIADPLVSKPYGYRHRARLSIRWKKGRMAFGFREKESSAICSITECPVLTQSLQPIPNQLREVFARLKKPHVISHVELFDADNGQAVLLRHIRSLLPEDERLLSEFAAQKHYHLYLQGDSEAIRCLNSYDHESSDDPWMVYRIPELNLTFRFEPADFTQVNASINRRMVCQAVEWLQLTHSDQVLDLFCGLGNFSLALAQQARQVTGVEGSEQAVRQARYNAGINGLENCDFYRADLSANVQSQDWYQRRYDALLLDPPRTGAIELIEQMAQNLPDRVLYISCNPATLARDAGALSQQGFRLQKLGVMDMFPQTAHIESMGLFVRD